MVVTKATTLATTLPLLSTGLPWIGSFKTRVAILILKHMILSMIVCAHQQDQLVFPLMSGLQLTLVMKILHIFTTSERKQGCLHLLVLQVQLGVHTSSMGSTICTKLSTQFHGCRKRGRWRVERRAWIWNNLYTTLLYFRSVNDYLHLLAKSHAGFMAVTISIILLCLSICLSLIWDMNCFQYCIINYLPHGKIICSGH